MKKKLLYIGHTGTLGQSFVRNYCDKFEIIGLARTALGHPKVRDVQANITKCNWDYVMADVGPVDAVVHSVMRRPWNPPATIAEFTDEFIMDELNLQVTSVFKLLRYLKQNWEGNFEGKSIVIVSSTSAKGSTRQNQFVYSPAKGAQLVIVENARHHFGAARIEYLLAGHFPSDDLPTATVAKQVHDLL